MKRLEKQAVISDLKHILNTANSVIVVHYKGLTVSDLEGLRDKAYKLEVGFKIVKNSLVSIASKESKNEILTNFFTGPVAILWGDDSVVCSKIVGDFAKTNDKLKIVGGSYEGKVLSYDDVKILSTLPSFDELRSKIVGLLKASSTKLSVVLKAYSEKA